MTALIPERDERARVGEAYLRGYYDRFAVAGGLGMCVAAASAAIVDQGSGAGPSLLVIGGLAAVEIAASCTGRARGRCYRLLRGRAYILALPALLALVLARTWPAVDQNAMYFAVAGPIAAVVGVGQTVVEGLGTIVLIGAATAASAATSRADPALAAFQQQITATLGVILSGVALKIVVQCSAMVVIEAAHAPEDPATAEESRVEPTAVVPPLGLARSSEARPLRALAKSAVAELASWRQAIIDLLRSDQARSRVFHILVGFPARELQVILLLHRYSRGQVADYLSISASGVDKAVRRAMDRRINAEGRPIESGSFTRAQLSEGLAHRYRSAVDIEQLSHDVDEEMSRRRERPT